MDPGAQALSGRSQGSSGRNLGLDIVRSAAIILVVVDHAAQAIRSGGSPPALALDFAGNFGVELFFALSGFLIGGLLLEVPTGSAAWPGTRRFWVRRWLRTLPAYYVFFGLFAWVQPPVNIATAFFVQRFFPQPEGFFTVAWSLAMEEWFYLLFPALALLTGAVLRRRDRRGIVLWTGVSVIILCCAARYAAIDLNLDWPILLGDLSFARHPILRLDCCAYGVVLAALVHGEGTRVAPAVGRLTPPGALGLCALPIIGLGALFVILAPSDPALQLRIFFPHWAVEYFTFDYPLLDCAAAGIVAIAYFASPALSPRLAGAIGLFSRASYSLYLVHTLGNFLWLGPLLLVLGPAGGIAAHLVLAVLLAIASYYAIERPFLSLRDRFFPSASTTG